MQQAGACCIYSLNPRLQSNHPLSGGYGLRFAPAGTSVASISFRNLADTPVRRLVPPSLIWIPSTNNIADIGFTCAKPHNPSRLLYNGHCEESPWAELPAAVAVAAGVRIFQLRCQYASYRKYHLP